MKTIIIPIITMLFLLGTFSLAMAKSTKTTRKLTVSRCNIIDSIVGAK